MTELGLLVSLGVLADPDVVLAQRGVDLRLGGQHRLRELERVHELNESGRKDSGRIV